ncbi:hypothetical protein [Tahibacter soli]|uniref:Uncharacterized protein n=1 Tax=Tahibacter soli TaxID=2983605 RepID=A0A9X3YK47_9GAMM|nr:hypothetical protein [Tahibacter soli]MDC8012263.1 hypothetical protein [Tahibacter soli]
MPRPVVNRYFIRRLQAKQDKRTRVWNAMRILRDFTVGDLLAVCELTNRQSLLTFCSQLRRAGYLLQRRGDEPRHEQARYRLIRNSGPACPALVRKGTALFDPNTETEHPLCTTKTTG